MKGRGTHDRCPPQRPQELQRCSQRSIHEQGLWDHERVAGPLPYAIGANLTDIRYAGGWSTNSTVLEAKYIDFTMRPSLAAWIFFGYLYRGTPRGDS